MKLTLKLINKALIKKGLEPITRKDLKNNGEIKLTGDNIQKINKKLSQDGCCYLRVTNKTKKVEMIDKMFVTVAPRYNFEKVNIHESLPKTS